MVIGNKAHDIRIEGGAFSVVSGTNVPMVRLMDSSYNIHGYLYATNSSEVGLLDADGQWAYKTMRDNHHQWRINNQQRLFMDNTTFAFYPSDGLQMDVTNNGMTIQDSIYCNDYRVRSGNDLHLRGNSIIVHGSSPQHRYMNNSDTTLGYVFGNDNGFGLLADSGHWAYQITSSAHQHKWHVNTVHKMTLTSTELRVIGQVSASGGNSSNWNTAYGWGDHSTAGYQTGKSDIRLKTNVSTVENALDKVSKLRGVTFDWKQNATNEPADTGGGVIAQEVEKVIPEFVHDIGNGSGMKTVDYNGLIGVLIESVKELKEQVNSCKCNCNCKGE